MSEFPVPPRNFWWHLGQRLAWLGSPIWAGLFAAGALALSVFNLVQIQDARSDFVDIKLNDARVDACADLRSASDDFVIAIVAKRQEWVDLSLSGKIAPGVELDQTWDEFNKMKKAIDKIRLVGPMTLAESAAKTQFLALELLLVPTKKFDVAQIDKRMKEFKASQAATITACKISIGSRSFI